MTPAAVAGWIRRKYRYPETFSFGLVEPLNTIVWVPYALAIALLIFGLYDNVLNVFWHTPIIPLREMMGL